MAPTLSPAAVGQEAAACAALGACLGAVRAFFPQKGRGAVLPDAFWVGALLLAVQSYAAGGSVGGVLRWYMVLFAAAAAGASAVVLGPPLRALGRQMARAMALPCRWMQKWVLHPVRRAHAERIRAGKMRRNIKRSEKNTKKNLPNKSRLLYNSNI